MTAPVKYIVFDWNGTLIDDTHLVFDSTNAVFAYLNRSPLSRAQFDAEHIIPLDAFFRRVGVSEADIERLAHGNSVFHDYYETHETTADLRDGARDVLNLVQMSGMQSLILSNHIVDPIRKLLRHHAIENYFVDVLAYPSRALQFKEMTKGERLRRYFADRKVAPGNGLIIGDTEEEARIGRELGLVSVAITGGIMPENRLLEGKPDYLIHSLHELKPILQERGFVA